MQSTSQYYFVITRLAQRTSQYYFVLQSLHKVLTSTTSYNKACTKRFAVLLHTTKLAQRSFYTEKLLELFFFAIYTKKLFHRNSFRHRSFCTQMLLHAASSYTEKLLHTEDLTHSKLLHSETFTHSEHLDTDRSFYTQQAFTHSKLLQTANFYTQKPLQREAFTHRSFTQRNFFHIEAFTRNVNRNCSSKTETGGPKRKKDDFEAFFFEIHFFNGFKNKMVSRSAPKLLTNHHRNRNFHAATPIRFVMPSCKRP